MKSLLLMAALLITGLSSASTQAERLQIKRFAGGFEYSGSSFHFNAEEGTAWIQVELTRPISSGLPCFRESGSSVGNVGYEHGSCAPQFDHRTEGAYVPRLSYDAAAAQIIFVSKYGRKTICATVTEKRGIFGGRKSIIRLTGSCNVSSRHEGIGTAVYFTAN